MNNILVTGVGSYLPKKIICSNDLPLELDTRDEWIKKRIGIRQRHIVSNNQLTLIMAIYSSKKAIFNTKLDCKDLDLVILDSTTPDNIVDIYANTSAASIPLALCYAVDKKIVNNGDIIALNAIGGGLRWGASVIKYGKPN